ncbi:uncharacterized protein JN550_011235 [Neoarthrinium moseri]|uniref:uncharacterized protein n=1 Tax=Neoarthrinium moseri TaxID=1658444 RepID=UPI001FDE4FD5|nr:uncharacterized protein JN550_011235 [Neoarthrinium moseri]KAI1860920.1 hypothetical protein JN550_011235 [Neoarthrinium moseri]
MALLNTTFTAHRLSPLHVGSEPLTPQRLATLSKRLRDVLVGDVVRGVQVGLDTASSDAAALGQTGALESVEWDWAGVRGMLEAQGEAGEDTADDDEQDAASPAPEPSGRRGGRRGGQRKKRNNATVPDSSPGALKLELKYESNAFSALLLPALSGDAQSSSAEEQQQWTSHPSVPAPANPSNSTAPAGDSFLALPLLLIRAPAPLRAVLTDFLTRTFDVRVSPLGLDPGTLVAAFERWLVDSGSVGGGARAGKDVVLTLGFTPAAVSAAISSRHGTPAADDAGQGGGEEGATAEKQPLGLKSIDVTIPAEDVGGFVRAGRAAETAQPFTDALADYLRHHLALDTRHAAVRVLRIACDGFVLSEGRVRLSQGGDAAWNLLDGLVQKAKGKGLRG